MSRSSHTPPMPTHADLMLAEKLRRELGGEAAAREDADTQPENVTHLPAIEVEDANKKYVPLASPPRRARVKTEPMANVIVGVTVPPVPPAPRLSRRAETTAPRRRSSSLVIPMEKRGVMIGVAIVLAACMSVSAIFVVGASTGSASAPALPPTTTATVATTTMATVVVPTRPATADTTAPIPEALEPTPSPPRPRVERSERPANAASPTSAAQHSSARATTTPAVVETAHDTTKDDIERKIR